MINVAFNNETAHYASENSLSSSKDITIILSILASIGDITDLFNVASRVEMYKDILGPYSDEYLRKLESNILLLEKHNKNPEEFRIWINGSTDDYCGLCYILTILKDFHTVYCINTQTNAPLFDMKKTDNELFQTQFQVSEACKCKANKQWTIYQNDNRFLRVRINNQIISVPDNFYDFLIYEYAQTATSYNQLLGAILRKNLEISDWWVKKRVEVLLRQNKLTYNGSGLLCIKPEG